MRNIVKEVLSGADTGSVTGSQIPANQLISASFHGFFGADANAAGTFKIQASNDLPPNGQLSDFTVTNWVDIPNATAAVTSSGSALITIAQTSYQWMRAVYTRASGGSTTVKVNMNALSI